MWNFGVNRGVRVIVDTTVQPRSIMFPADAELLNRAREKGVTLARKKGP